MSPEELQCPAPGATMWAARLHGPAEVRVERIPVPEPPGPGQALIRVAVTGVCGSDLHAYQDARLGDTPREGPLILGHEFAGTVAAVGPDALDGRFAPLTPGARVAVDPAQPCGRCEFCEQGHPNLCARLHFCGSYPDDGSLCEWIVMPARSCFPLPDALDDEAGALLEPLGVALHAVDLARLRVGDSVAILGAGPIGLLILQLARLAGADPVFVVEPRADRRRWAERWGGVPVGDPGEAALQTVRRETGGRGVDVAFEAAWADRSVNDAAELARLGGRLVLVGIPGDDRLVLRHSTARRKGLTIRLCRRMKHVYPRAIRLVESGRVDVRALISHRFPLAEAPRAFALAAAAQPGVVKVLIQS